MTKRFVTPFAASGDKLAVPDATQPDGSVSYNIGFGVDYQRPIGDPLRKTMPRDSTNQLFFDLTEFAKEVQDNGVPPWRNDVDYAIGAVTLGSNGKLYRATQISGPGTTPRDPVTQPAYWTAFFTEAGGTFTGPCVFQDVTATSLRIGVAALYGIATGQTSHNPPSIAAFGNYQFNVSAAGAKVGDLVCVSWEDTTWHIAMIRVSAFVPSDDTVTVVIVNLSASPIDLPVSTVSVATFDILP